jgi:hypothetical protein
MLGEFNAAHGNLWGRGKLPAMETRRTPRAPPLQRAIPTLHCDCTRRIDPSHCCVDGLNGKDHGPQYCDVKSVSFQQTAGDRSWQLAPIRSMAIIRTFTDPSAVTWLCVTKDT